MKRKWVPVLRRSAGPGEILSVVKVIRAPRRASRIRMRVETRGFIGT
jgi:hypothetical protein